MTLTIGVFPGLMIGMEWYDGDGTTEDAFIIDFLCFRAVIEF